MKREAVQFIVSAIVLALLICSVKTSHAISIGDVWKATKNIIADGRDFFNAPSKALERTLGELKLEPVNPGPLQPNTITCMYMVDGFKQDGFIFDLRDNATVFVCYGDGRFEDYRLQSCDWEKGKCPKDAQIDTWISEQARSRVIVSDDPQVLEKASARAINALNYALPQDVRDATRTFTVKSKKNCCTLTETGWSLSDIVESVIDYIPVPVPET